jgi:predicted transcriptional regulator
MTSIEDEVNEEWRGVNYDWIASSDASPEQVALMGEQDGEARREAQDFLNRLSLMVRSNAQRTERLWRVLWHCFLDPNEPTQLEIADIVGLSDSSVSDYRRKIETELRKLNFTPEQVSAFAEELDEQLLRWRLPLNVERPKVRSQPGRTKVHPSFSDEQSDKTHDFASVAQSIQLNIESLPLGLCLESNPC